MKHHDGHHVRTTISRSTGGRAVGLAAATAIAVGVVAVPAGGDVAAEDPGIDCAEWDAGRFSADAERVSSWAVELSMTYDDTADAPLDVCPYTIFFSLRSGDGTVVWAGAIGADDVASATELTGSFDHSMLYDDCDWEVHLAVEESLPIVIEATEFCLGDLAIHLEPKVPLRPVLPPIWASSSFAFAR